MNKQQAARLLSQVQRAGARHSRSDNDLIQQLHDLTCKLGAECEVAAGEGMSVEDLRRYAPNPLLKAALLDVMKSYPHHAGRPGRIGGSAPKGGGGGGGGEDFTPSTKPGTRERHNEVTAFHSGQQDLQDRFVSNETKTHLEKLRQATKIGDTRAASTHRKNFESSFKIDRDAAMLGDKVKTHSTYKQSYRQVLGGGG